MSGATSISTAESLSLFKSLTLCGEGCNGGICQWEVPTIEVVPQETDEEVVSQETDEDVASQETDEDVASQETDEDVASQETDEDVASQETDEEVASQETSRGTGKKGR
jgi:hypothetical protein